MKKVLILGNGISRLKYKTWINKWDGEIWACNRAFREYKYLPRLNVIGTVHHEVAIEALTFQKKKALSYKILTSKAGLVNSYQVFLFKKYRGWSTGNELLQEALLSGYDQIYLAGFDMGGPDIYNGIVEGSNFRIQMQKIIEENGGAKIKFVNDQTSGIKPDANIEIVQKPENKKKKVVQQYHKTKIAYAPQIISNNINKYSDKYVSINSPNIQHNADIIHFHNKWEPTNKKGLIQYHSQPYIAMTDFKGSKYCIAQYPAMYKKEYGNFGLVRNIIDLDSPYYNKYVEVNKKIIVAYTPSTVGSHSRYADKGYVETLPILEKLKKQYPTKFDFHCITRKPLNEALRLKQEANVVIDECKTGSYHRCTLEGLAMGKMSIVYVQPEIEAMFKSVSKTDIIPYENVQLNNLEAFLFDLIRNNKMNYIIDRGQKAYEWMKTYWHHKDIVKEFEEIYDKILGE